MYSRADPSQGLISRVKSVLLFKLLPFKLLFKLMSPFRHPAKAGPAGHHRDADITPYLGREIDR